MDGEAEVRDQIRRRHKAAARVVNSMLLFSALLVAFGFFAAERLHAPGDPSVIMGLWIAILLFGLGAFVFRRTKLAAMRLQDIAALRGLDGLLGALYSTTVQIAFIGATVVVMALVATILTGNKFDMIRGGGVALIVLLYGYPIRSLWERVVLGIERAKVADFAAKGNTS